MGVAFKDLIKKEELELKELKDKVLVIDTFNMLYQFITTIRGPDGSVFTDSKGRVTSHIIGLFSRIVRFLEIGIKPAFVFDGIAPDLKKVERKRRKELKLKAKAKYEIAVKEKDMESMKKFASRTSRLTQDMIDDAKDLLEAFGIPIIQAPSEGESQAAYMVSKGDAYASVSQDYDSLLFGCTILIHNLSIAGKRKKIHGIGYKTVKPEKIFFSDVMNELGIDQDGLIVLGMLVGTDYNIGGIKGIGPKNALKNVKQYQGNYDEMFKNLKWDDFFDVTWQEVFNVFKKMPVSDDYELKWDPIDKEKLRKVLIEKHEFSEERVNSSLERLKKHDDKKKQKSLGDFM